MASKRISADEVHYFLERYSVLASEEDEARDKGDFAKVDSHQKARDYIEKVLSEIGFILHFDEGQGIWMLALRDQLNPENV